MTLLLAHTLEHPGTRGCLHPALPGAAGGWSVHFARLSHRRRGAGLPGVACPPHSHCAPGPCRPFLRPVSLHPKPTISPASYALTRHLLELGHKRIAFLAGPPATPWARERFEGYRRALREAGMDVDDKLVFQAGPTIEDGARAAAQMLAESASATAVQAVNDLVALGCAGVFLEHGLRIPRDISLGRLRQY